MSQLLRQVQAWWLRRSEAVAAHPFDVAYGMDTSGLYYADRLPTGHAHDRYSEGYYATAPSLFHGAMSLWVNGLDSGARVEDYTFVDLGSGKGRVVMMASLYPFRAVRGIELNADLIGVARRNMRRWVRGGRAVCRDVRLVQGDVLGPEMGAILKADVPVILFIFNSFGAEVMGPVMERLARADGRRAPVDLVYVHPDQERLVAATRGVKLLCCKEIPFSEEDARADVFGVASDVCSVYKCGGLGTTDR